MKQRLILIVFLTLAVLPSFGQSAIDSLKALATSAQADSAQFQHFIELNNEYLLSNLDSALVYAKKALEAAQRTESDDHMADANYGMPSRLLETRTPPARLGDALPLPANPLGDAISLLSFRRVATVSNER